MAFTDGKSPDAFRTISEVSAHLGVPPHILRFWETRFPQLKPMQRGGNRRYYRPADVALAAALHRLLHRDGYTVKGVQKLISEHGADGLVALANGAAVAPKASAQPAEAPETAMGASTLIPELRGLRDRLAAALAA